MDLEKRRLNATILMSQGLKASEVASLLGVTPRSLSRWSRSAKFGIQGLKSKGSPGPKPILTKEGMNEIRNYLGNRIFCGIKMKRKQDERKIKVRFAQGYIISKYKHCFHRTYVYRIIKKLR